MTRSHLAALVAVLPLAAAGCGGSDGDATSSASRTSSTAAAPAGTTSTAAAPASATASPQQTLAEVKAALVKVKSFHIDGHQVDEDGRTRLQGDFTSEGSLRIKLTVAKRVADLLVVDDVTYIRANRAYWLSEGKGPTATKVADLLADRWAKIPAAGAGDFKKDLQQLSPKGLADCLTTGNGTVTSAGEQVLDGKKVTVLKDRGDKPGTAPGLLYLAAEGALLPVRETQTGRQRPGGTDTDCGDPKSTTTEADFRITDYDKPVDIKAPADALDLEKLQSGQDDATPS